MAAKAVEFVASCKIKRLRQVSIQILKLCFKMNSLKCFIAFAYCAELFK